MPENTTTTETTTAEVKDLYLSNDSVRKLIELLIAEMKTRVPEVASVIPMTTEEANAADVKDKIPTVLAVYNALSSVDHIKFRIMKGAVDQTFEDYMGDTTPEELALYFYKTADKVNYDLWIYDSQTGYVRVGYDSVSEEDLNLTNYWSKDELDVTAYWRKDELSIDDITGGIDLGNYVTTADLEAYVKKDEIGTMTAEEVEVIFNEVKAAQA